jgi:endonuclease YncB( thermonuclease family)
MLDWARHTRANTPAFDLDGVVAEARVVGCHDGDTVTCLVPVPWAGGAVRRVNLRLAGIDAPELRSGPAGAAARARVLRWLGVDDARDLETRVVTAQARCRGPDKYGRCLATLHRGAECLNDVLLADGHAVPYTGRGAKSRAP